jgi:hypothetical protein
MVLELRGQLENNVIISIILSEACIVPKVIACCPAILQNGKFTSFSQ